MDKETENNIMNIVCGFHEEKQWMKQVLLEQRDEIIEIKKYLLKLNKKIIKLTRLETKKVD